MNKVTYSVALAIRFMLNLTWQREDSYTFQKCPALKPVAWCNFLFFRRVVPRPIQRIRRVEPTAETVGYWEVERKVDFYLHDQLVGVVTLQGQKQDRTPGAADSIRKFGLDAEDALSCWAVSHVWYFRVVDRQKRSEHIETDVPFYSYCSGTI
jgi:hypothetical protein